MANYSASILALQKENLRLLELQLNEIKVEIQSFGDKYQNAQEIIASMSDKISKIKQKLETKN
jgi:hypothetical protein